MAQGWKMHIFIFRFGGSGCLGLGGWTVSATLYLVRVLNVLDLVSIWGITAKRPHYIGGAIHFIGGRGCIRLVSILWLSCSGTALCRGLKKSALLSGGVYGDGIDHWGCIGVGSNYVGLWWHRRWLRKQWTWEWLWLGMNLEFWLYGWHWSVGVDSDSAALTVGTLGEFIIGLKATASIDCVVTWRYWWHSCL